MEVVPDRPNRKGGRLWASLVGPLFGLYYPCPDALEDEGQFRVALNHSRLAKLWCAVYSEEEVDALLAAYGGVKLPVKMSVHLDYDSYRVEQYRRTGR